MEAKPYLQQRPQDVGDAKSMGQPPRQGVAAEWSPRKRGTPWTPAGGTVLRQTFGSSRVPKGAPDDGQEAAAFPLLDFSLGLL